MNKQTKSLKSINVSCKAARGGNNTTPTFHEYPAPPCQSKRKTKWGLKLPQNEGRQIIYMEEHKNRVKK